MNLARLEFADLSDAFGDISFSSGSKIPEKNRFIPDMVMLEFKIYRKPRITPKRVEGISRHESVASDALSHQKHTRCTKATIAEQAQNHDTPR